jgi:hypothetical protein
MPFPISTSEIVIAGGVGPSDVESCARWLAADLRRNRATGVSIGDHVVRFRSLLAFRGPLMGIGGGAIDLREAGESGKIRVSLSFAPLAALAAAFVTVSVASEYASETFAEGVVLWAATFLLLFGPCYLLLPARFSQFLESSIKRYYESRTRP